MRVEYPAKPPTFPIDRLECCGAGYGPADVEAAREEDWRGESEASGVARGTVETANNGVTHQRGFRKIGGVNHLIGQRGKLRAGQLPSRIQTIRKTDHFSLLIGRQSFQFMDELACGHVLTVEFPGRSVNPDSGYGKEVIGRERQAQMTAFYLPLDRAGGVRFNVRLNLTQDFIVLCPRLSLSRFPSAPASDAPP